MDLVFVILLTLLMVPVALLASGALRIVLAAAFLVFFPGYTLVAALFPRKDSLDYLERITLSLVLSIAVVPLLGMVLNFTPWGIDTYPVVATVLGFVLICSLVALCRRRRLPEEDRFPPRIRPAVPRFGGAMPDRVLAGALALVVLAALGTLVYVIAFPRDVETFSEFCLLGSEGMMQGYPQEAVAGQPVVVTVAITNRERAYAAYVVETTIDGDLVSRTDTVRLANDKTWEGKLSFVPTKPGADQRVEFLLFKDDGNEPYLTLHLMLDVRAGP
jgi:uncharacterized membrane protein